MGADDRPQTNPSILDAIQRAQPRWLQDGMGVRGNPITPSSSGPTFSTPSSASPAADPQITDFGGTAADISLPSSSPSVSAVSATSTRYPWDIIATTHSLGATTIKIWPGNINGFIPSNITDSFSVNDTDLWFVKCKINSDGRSITGIQLMVDTAQPNQQQATANAMPSEFEIVVAGYDQGVAYNLYRRSFAMIPSTVFSYGYWTIG